MVILVVGGAGFIGCRVVQSFLENGDKVIVVDDLSTGSKEAVDVKAVFYRMDIKEERRLEELFNAFEIDAVIHLGFRSFDFESVEEPLQYFENNVSGTIVLLKVMKRHHVQFLVWSSSVTSKSLSPYDESLSMVETILSRVDYAHDIKSMNVRRFGTFEGDMPVMALARAYPLALTLLMEHKVSDVFNVGDEM